MREFILELEWIPRDSRMSWRPIAVRNTLLRAEESRSLKISGRRKGGAFERGLKGGSKRILHGEL